ncbi:MAG: putative toxin-antitoxin system toxin component, PIN family [Acidimicrobiia bacterium]
MIRAVVDPNVIISAMLSREGSPAVVLRGWLRGEFEMIVSPLLLAELERALDYPKTQQRITSAEAGELVEWLTKGATMADDSPGPPPVRSPDAGDDYLISLASAQSAVLVSGDHHLLTLQRNLPVFKPADFLTLLREDLRQGT